MPQLVFEFWSQEIEPVVEAISRVLDGCSTENAAAVLPLHYEPTQQGLDWAAQHVSTGKVSSSCFTRRMAAFDTRCWISDARSTFSDVIAHLRTH